MASKKKNGVKLSPDQKKELLKVLKDRFEKNMNRHKNFSWEAVRSKLDESENKVWSVHQMEKTGGEPDVLESGKGEFIFIDCSPESPSGRRSLCYDEAALLSRKENKPKGSAHGMAEEMGIELIDEEQYRRLQKTGNFDLKTSSWLKTPEDIRKLGGSLFGDRRYNTVFVYHNGAESYYAARGFRGAIRL